MKLYDKNTLIDIYEMTPDEEKIRKYKEKQLNELEINELFYTIMNNASERPYEFYEKFLAKIRIDYNDVSYEGSDYSNFYLQSKYAVDEDLVKMSALQIILLQQYINGNFNNNPLKVIKKYRASNDEILNYLLFLDLKNYNSAFSGSIKIMNILSLPEKLYHLHELETGHFKDINDEHLDCSEQLKLFDINLTSSISSSQLDVAYETGLVRGSMSDVEDKITTTRPILVQAKILKK